MQWINMKRKKIIIIKTFKGKWLRILFQLLWKILMVHILFCPFGMYVTEGGIINFFVLEWSFFLLLLIFLLCINSLNFISFLQHCLLCTSYAFHSFCLQIMCMVLFIYWLIYLFPIFSLCLCSFSFPFLF
jgi:hypothetical protein